jgi:hypothetical protein
MAESASALIKRVGLTPAGPVQWGERVPSGSPGVYIVQLPRPVTEAPIDLAVVDAWIRRVPDLRLDGERPTALALAGRLREFWLPTESVAYVGLTARSLGRRISDYYRTALGDRRPHAGGHWIKTLRSLETFLVWWAETDEPVTFEVALLDAFAAGVSAGLRRRLPGQLALPFANRQTATGQRKPNGITGSVLSPTPEVPAARPVGRPSGQVTGALRRRRSTVEEINAALQRIVCKSPAGELTAVEAAAELDRLGILRDSRHRPGLPLRELLREGWIDFAYQEPNRRWHIRCGQR